MNNKEYRPTLAQLRTFVTIAENKHFGVAAQKLHISQPSLSQALSALEIGLEVQLIERSTRRVIITPAGEELLPYAKAVLDSADSFLSHAQGVSGMLSGPLTLGIIPTIAPYILPPLLTEINKDYSDLDLRIVEDQTQHLVQLLKDGQIDCALLALPIDQPGIEEISLYSENFVMVVPRNHPLAGRNDLELTNLKDIDLILLDDGHCLREQSVNLCKKVDINPSNSPFSNTRASSLTTVMQLISSELGGTLVPESAIAIECSRVDVATAYFSDEVSAARQVGLIYRSSSSRSDEYHKLGTVINRAFHHSIATT
ncbi:hydrogen peroxide-inducible genes activator [Corynebacterium sp. sy017]|uniref:hydrogen peroxide-inducible genes activator n=1 Tax=unclassified Corynebacterium TaxID=2624378 RepID=UPI001186981D|nr:MULTISPECIES: hydrogen peroxide-inducible genes activator [unclassified Corynebacterium]MBP3087770.1 hydrogen peroxide-inducible genes activator [Corynebacterium sp. sy017]TSD92319.1 hydrogen peroxide-inducible genes activator [Corynebacterium sp. SY003]